MLPRAHSPIDPHRARPPGLHDSSYDDDRSYRTVTPFRDANPPPYRERPLTPGALPPFRDTAVTSSFRDRTMPSANMTSGGANTFQDNTLSPYILDDRSQTIDYWSPGVLQAGVPSAWDPRIQRPDQRLWQSRPPAPPQYPISRPFVNTGQRSFLEPSQAWKRAREERDRQLR